MFIVNIMGGLGNQMFQYAFGRSLSTSNQVKLNIDVSNFSQQTRNLDHSFQLEFFQINACFLTANQSSSFKWKRKIDKIKYNSLRKLLLSISKCKSIKIYSEPPNSAFKEDVLEIHPPAYLSGYFNSYKYFDKIESKILKEFIPKRDISRLSKNFLGLIEGSESVGVHIRRGDYITDLEIRRELEGIISARYYVNAFEYIKSVVKDPHFFFFSDDIEWVKKNIRPDNKFTYVDINSSRNGCEDLWLMSRCKHNITCGGSTFSWWASYLNPNPEKIVLRTKQISKNPNYNHPNDFFPSNWVQIDS
jgi:hypothetical protein